MVYFLYKIFWDDFIVLQDLEKGTKSGPGIVAISGTGIVQYFVQIEDDGLLFDVQYRAVRQRIIFQPFKKPVYSALVFYVGIVI